MGRRDGAAGVHGRVARRTICSMYLPSAAVRRKSSAAAGAHAAHAAQRGGGKRAQRRAGGGALLSSLPNSRSARSGIRCAAMAALGRQRLPQSYRRAGTSGRRCGVGLAPRAPRRGHRQSARHACWLEAVCGAVTPTRARGSQQWHHWLERSHTLKLKIATNRTAALCWFYCPGWQTLQSAAAGRPVKP